MTNVSPTGGIVPLTIPIPQAANQTSKPAETAQTVPVVPPISKSDLPQNNLPQNGTAETVVRALAERKQRDNDITERIADALSGSGLNVIRGEQTQPERTSERQPSQLRVAVPDAIPDEIPY